MSIREPDAQLQSVSISLPGEQKLAVWVLAGGLVGLLLAHPSLYSRSLAYILLIQAIFLVWLVILVRERFRWKWMLPPKELVGAVSLLGVGSLLAWFLSPLASVKSLFFLSAQFLFLWLGWWLGRDQDLVKLLGGVALWGAGVASVYGLFQYWQLDPLSTVTLFADRVVSFFENPNHFGNYLAGLLPLGLVAFLQAVNWKSRSGWCALVGLMYIGLLITASRGAWWAALAGSLVLLGGYVYQVYRGVVGVRWIWIGVLLVLLGTITALFSEQTVTKGPAGPVSVRERMLSSKNIVEPGAVEDFAIAHRYRIWQVTWEMIRERPLLGQGYGVYPRRFVEIRKTLQERGVFSTEEWNTYFDTPYAHNEYLHIWAESGLLGLAGFMGLITLVVWYAVRGGWRTRLERLDLWGALGLVAAMLVHSMVSYPLHLSLNGMVFWLALGILANREFVAA